MPAGEWKLKQFSVFYQLRHIFDDNTIIDDEIRMKKLLKENGTKDGVSILAILFALEFYDKIKG
ncbi:hypothetical protein [Treponema bryantii]|uniref:hypothetical protein n=1 Tax=Treponema bryantii TaxID=163 RepID=UPI002B27ECC4|nr:hypothetical protein TRBR_01220 [Treponema bryantii]